MEVILQASLQSKRLPRKVLLPIKSGEPMAVTIAKRWRRAGHQVILSLPVEREDDELHQLMRAMLPSDIQIVRLVTKDETYNLRPILERVCKGELVARITADCPFVDPALLPDPLWYLAATRRDGWLGGYPPGFDIEVFHRETILDAVGGDLDAAWRKITPWVAPAPDDIPPGLSCTIDYYHDWRWCQMIQRELGEEDATWATIARWWRGERGEEI